MYEKEVASRRHYERRARWYDTANRLAAIVRGTSMMGERRKAVAQLALTPGDAVLEVAIGTGTNVRLMHEALQAEGRIVGLDISRAMLERCRDKVAADGVGASLVEADGARLPLRDAAFDAVFHHGGMAEFGDKKAAIAEMARVTRAGGRIVICDVGMPTDRRLSLVNRLLLRTQPVYDAPPPVDLLPPAARDVSVTWLARGSWYSIAFVNGA
jgi:ubiquinone/menaquinone biosynthesis C-methylase UbiE